ncbi:MAG TPA: class I SAM-dependent methyltransferase [Verrucomicrobiae bacterium]|nr:class I SAM-dependent methyltransferase [Verrucomicrobiae bacterium]
MSLLEQATSVEQYNTADMDWEAEGNPDSPVRQFLGRVIGITPIDVEAADVLDVGCGSGWFLQRCAQLDAYSLVGVEPSRYAEMATRLVPRATIYNQTFESFATEESFDLVSMIMSTEHLADLEDAFLRSRLLLRASSMLLVVAGDYDAFRAPRFDYTITEEIKQPGKEAVVRVERPSSFGTTTDILRTVDYWSETAEESGFKVADHQPVFADDQLVEAIPKYEIYKETPVMQLFRFKKEP